MSTVDLEWLDVRGGRVGVDRATGTLRLTRSGIDRPALVGDPATSGLVRIAAPLPDYPGHFAQTGLHGAPEVDRLTDGLRLRYPTLTTEHAELAVRVEVDLRSGQEGLVLRARVRNDSELAIPQVAFPQLMGLTPTGSPDDTRLRLSRGTLHPLRDLVLRPDDATFLETPLQRYFGYGAFEFSMKWLDYGSADGGVTLYSTDRRYATQGLLVERPDRVGEQVNLRWLHYPTIRPGEEWDSGEFVLLAHPGDWYAGARAFAEFAAEAYPYRAPRHIREALGIRTVWPAMRNAPPTFTLEQLPDYAAELTDPDLGLTELCVWHWWQKNGLPVLVDPRLGTEDDLRAALGRCRELGVPVSLFVSHHLLRDTDETPPEWKHLNAAGQPVQDNWTYGPDFLPRWRVPFMGTHAMVRGSAAAPGWREAALTTYARLLDVGATSICFDQFWAWFEPNLNPAADAEPDGEGDRLLELGHAAHDLVTDRDPNGTFSGEMPTEQKVPILDYTWEWRNSFELDDDAPFRYVFPQVRLNANVNEHPRGAVLAFADGGLLNVMPGQMQSFRLADCPALVTVLRQLAALRRRFLRFFCEGEYRHVEGMTVSGCHARAYSHGDDVLLVLVNPGDDAAAVEVGVDPGAWGGRSDVPRERIVIGLDGRQVAASDGPELGYRGVLPPDGLVAVLLSVGEESAGQPGTAAATTGSVGAIT